MRLETGTNYEINSGVGIAVCEPLLRTEYSYMSADSGQEVAIFTDALKRPAAERPAFLDRACAGDAELRRKVEALLHAYEHLGDFMETPPPESGSSVILDPENNNEPPEPNSNAGDSDSK